MDNSIFSDKGYVSVMVIQLKWNQFRLLRIQLIMDTIAPFRTIDIQFHLACIGQGATIEHLKPYRTFMFVYIGIHPIDA